MAAKKYGTPPALTVKRYLAGIEEGVVIALKLLLDAARQHHVPRRPRRAGLPTRRVAEPDLRRCSQHNCSYFLVLDRWSVPVHIPSDVE